MPRVFGQKKTCCLEKKCVGTEIRILSKISGGEKKGRERQEALGSWVLPTQLRLLRFSVNKQQKKRGNV